MGKDRLLAITDGVVAIIITIMVLDLKVPAGVDFAALREVGPTFLAYVLSFVYVGIYWNNHHHYFQLVRHVNGAMLWANFHLLFWLSLVPFATAWMGERGFAPLPTALYGLSLFMPGIAWVIMQRVIYAAQGPASPLKAVLGNDIKARISPLFYAAGIGLSFVASWAALLCYLAVGLMWLVPDRRVEKVIAKRE
jgi:uncharacterized membrane protein